MMATFSFFFFLALVSKGVNLMEKGEAEEEQKNKEAWWAEILSRDVPRS